MNKKNKSAQIKIWATEYERILTHFAQPNDSSSEIDDADVPLLCELLEAKLLTGNTIKDKNGVSQVAAVTGMTVEGRLFLDKLREERQIWPPARKLFSKFIFWLWAALGTLVVGLATAWLCGLL